MRARTDSRGFTLIELCIALGLLTLMFIKLTLMMNDATTAHRRESVSMALEDRAALVLDRIAYAVIGSDPDTLFPNSEAPFFADRIEFKLSLGVEDGKVVWSDPEVIGLQDDPSLLYWARNEGEVGEQIVIWCRTVAEYFATELGNGEDDNDNGVTDETGLNFVLDGESVTIRLTIERTTPEGPVRHTQETVVTCRN